MTGVRRGELLGFGRRDVDLSAGTVSVRRSAVPVREHGKRAEVKEGRERGTLALSPARDDALIFGDLVSDAATGPQLSDQHHG